MPSYKHNSTLKEIQGQKQYKEKKQKEVRALCFFTASGI